jgi:hypothetical protein
MFILARGGRSYARLEFHVGPGTAVHLPVEIDCRQAFAGSDHVAWRAEYDANVLCPVVPVEEGLFGQDALLARPENSFADDPFSASVDRLDDWERLYHDDLVVQQQERPSQ